MSTLTDTWQTIVASPEFQALSEEEQERVLARATMKDPGFQLRSPEQQMQTLQRVAPNIDIAPFLTQPRRGTYEPDISGIAEPIADYATRYGLPMAATTLAGGLGAAFGLSAKAIPALQAATNIAANYGVGNTELAKIEALPSLGGAIAQGMLGPTAGLMKQAGADALGSFLGYGANVATGIEESDPLQAGLAAGAPLLAGGVTAGGKRGIRNFARLIPGMEIALGEKALKDSDAMWQGLRPTEKSSDLYAALSKQGRTGPGVQLPNTVALRKQRYLEQKIDEIPFPNSTSTIMADTSGRSAIDEQVKRITEGKRQFKKLGADIRERAHTLDKKERAFNEAMGGMDVIAIHDAREEMEIARLRLDLADANLQLKQNQVKAAQGRAQQLFSPELEARFSSAHRQLKQLSKRIEAAATRGGEDLGELKQRYRALWTDIDEGGVYSAPLRQANNTFMREMAAERIGEMTTQSIPPSLDGNIVISADVLHAKIFRAFREDELFSRTYSAQQRKEILNFYSELARETKRENRIGLVVATSMIGGMIGQGLGIGWPTGSFIGVTAPNYLTRIAGSSPGIRKLMLDMVSKENGRISQQALTTIAQLAQQERARQVSYEIVEEEER